MQDESFYELIYFCNKHYIFYHLSDDFYVYQEISIHIQFSVQIFAIGQITENKSKIYILKSKK